MSTLLLSKPSEVPYGELIPTQIIASAYEELYSKKKKRKRRIHKVIEKRIGRKI